MIVTRIALLGLLGCSGVVFGMETDSCKFSKIIVNPTVKKVFLPDNKAISCTIGSDGHAYCLNVNDSVKGDQTIKNLLCIVKKQLDTLKLVDKDIFSISYTDISLSQKMDNKFLQKHNFFIQYTILQKNAWFNDTTIKPNYVLQVFKNISDNKELDISCSVYDDNDEAVDTAQVNDSSYDQLALKMLKDYLMYYVSSDQKNIAEIAKCWIGRDKPSTNNSSEFNTVTCGYDSGYEKCELYIDAEYDCTVMHGNKSYGIQGFNHEKLQEICKENKRFILAVTDPTNNQQIKMNIVEIRAGSGWYKLEANTTDAEILHVTLVTKDNPQKYTRLQKVHFYFNNYSGLIVSGGFLFSVLLAWIYCNMR